MKSYARFISVLAALILAGCSSRTGPREPVLPPIAPRPSPPVASTPATRTVIVTEEPALTPLVPPAAPGIATDWITWENWSQLEGLGIPRRVVGAATPTFALDTPGGVLTLTAGNQMVRCDGIGCWLAHVPKFSNGHVLIHRLDAAKSLRPLAGDLLTPPRTSGVIVLDPGHGGENPGTRSILGNRFEKEFTLDWAWRLAGLLKTNGWRVFLTRTNDFDVPLASRVAFADRVGADLFISLHFNSAFPRQEQAGLETYCLTPRGLPSTIVRDFEDDPTVAFPNNAFDTDNLHLAMRLHQALVGALRRPDRGVRRARFMGVLRGQNRPAVLVEGGYLSNPLEARLISSADYRQKLAEAMARALTPAWRPTTPTLQVRSNEAARESKPATP